MAKTTTRAGAGSDRAGKAGAGEPGDAKMGAGEMGAGEMGAGPPLNLSVLRGSCSAPPEVRVLESGSRLATFALRCPTSDPGRATSVPVTVWDPPAWLESVATGDDLIVVGRLRRRFYQRPGGLGSRVDVEAELVGRARDRRRVDAALRRAYATLEVLA